MSDLTTVSVLKSPLFPFLLLLKAKPVFSSFFFLTLVKEDLQLFNAKTKSRRTTGPIIDPVTRVELVGETLPSLCPHQWLAHHRKQRKLTELTKNQSFTSQKRCLSTPMRKARSSKFTPNKAIPPVRVTIVDPSASELAESN